MGESIFFLGGYKFREVKVLDLVYISNNYHISSVLCCDKNIPNCPEKKYGNIG